MVEKNVLILEGEQLYLSSKGCYKDFL